jgi:hypoxanthine phosphoribosyltransferase
VSAATRLVDTRGVSERETLTWPVYGDAAADLGRQVAASGFVPDIVLGIARGGLVLAASLAYALECKNLFTINVEFYTGVGTTLDAPVMLPPLLDTADLVDMSVLVVDDVADSGKTLELVMDFCHGHVSVARSAVLYEKPTTVVGADYVWRRTDRWIDFPWSS